MERLASFRQRDPRIAQAFIMFALLGSSSSCASVAHLAAVSHAAWLLVRIWCFPFSDQHILYTTRRPFSDGGEPLAASISEQPPQLRLSNAIYRFFLDRRSKDCQASW